jgi:hypothetical protein
MATAAVPLLVRNALELANELQNIKLDLSALSPDFNDLDVFIVYEKMHAMFAAQLKTPDERALV